MNILLIHPQCPETFWSYNHALWFIEKKAATLPLGLLTVAALLPEHWGKKLVDLQITALDPEDLSWADYVFISGMSIQRHSAREVIAQCKAAGKPVVAGGPLFTLEYALFEQVDHFILNEAELTLPPFLADLERNCAKRVYRSRNFADIRNTPVPLWSLADLSQYAWAGIQYSRGCPFNCEFCNVTVLLGHRARTKTGEQIIRELDSLHDAGWRGPVFFVDDNLIGNRSAARGELIPALIKWQQSRRSMVYFNTQVSINLADDDALIRDMVIAGFDTVFIGIETPDPDSLEECHKQQNQNRDMLRDIRRLQHAGFEVQGGFILGFDSDKPTIFQNMIEFIQSSGLVTAMVGILQSSPGTQLHNRLRNEGRLTGLSSGDNADGTTNFVPRMGLESLVKGYKEVLGQIYDPKLYYQRIRTFLRVYQPHLRRRRIRALHIRAFIRSLYQLGMVGRERIEFWKMIFWTICRNPFLLFAAVRMAICGNHYRRVFEDNILNASTSESDISQAPVATRTISHQQEPLHMPTQAAT